MLGADGGVGPGWCGCVELDVGCVCAGCPVDCVRALQVMQRVMATLMMLMVRVLQVMQWLWCRW